MKTRLLILLAITALVTLSFTFVTVKSSKSANTTEKAASVSENAPVGGFALEEAL